MLLAFLRLLGARGAIDQRPVERAALNRARARAAQPPLLDHFELILRIGEPSGARDSQGALRRTSRRHLVRGHVVHRQGKIFWRTSHYRGSIDSMLSSRRTARVAMARGFRYKPGPMALAE